MQCLWLIFRIQAILLALVCYTSLNGVTATDARAVELISKRDADHSHAHNAAPLLEINETEVLMYHSPTPESYYTIDWENALSSGELQEVSSSEKLERHPGMMILHALFMSLAFFVALPIGIAMRSVNHAWHGVAMGCFYGFSVLGCFSSAVYRKLTPNMYEGSVHGLQGYIFLSLASILTTFDLLEMFRRIACFLYSRRRIVDVRKPFQAKSFWREVVLGKAEGFYELGELEPSYTGLLSGTELEGDQEDSDKHNDNVRDSGRDTEQDIEEMNWEDGRRHHRSYSAATLASDTVVFDSESTDGTLHDLRSDADQPYARSPKVHLLYRLGRGVFAVSERVLVFGGLVQVVSGVVVYTGGCRQNYINGCLAHLIKGAIFWCYGLVSFARYLGAFAELGWSWNRVPSGKKYPSAEFVESLVIFVYGVTNTWMERFGAHAGDPFTTKQIQHIGIAVMFWFAGLVGMAIESKTIRKWLVSSTLAAIRPSSGRSREVVIVDEPPSYVASFNPFPALVIGVTGAAMSAHAQTYLFQVQIHVLWGNLLLAWSILRCCTYFFLYLSPPHSILPSRPPTEALGSFFLACGGLAFMFSTEELTLAAMRRGLDDVMMFLTVAVAMTCFALCWTFSIVGYKGYLKSHRAPRSPSYGA